MYMDLDQVCLFNRDACFVMTDNFSEIILLNPRVPQGDIISTYIFILAVEILLIKIKNIKINKGILFAKMESRRKLLHMIPPSLC